MTMPESPAERLAKALEQIKGVPPRLIELARAGYYGDYSSPLEFPDIVLVETLQLLASQPTTGPEATKQLINLMGLVMGGAFDGTKAEADAWMASEEGQQTLRDLLQGKMPGQT